MNKWTSVDDKLPKNEMVLICNDDGDVIVGSYEIRSDGPCWRVGNDCALWDYDFNCDFVVSYWMAIPELPEEV